jgi:hypothetical protein
MDSGKRLFRKFAALAASRRLSWKTIVLGIVFGSKLRFPWSGTRNCKLRKLLSKPVIGCVAYVIFGRFDVRLIVT